MGSIVKIRNKPQNQLSAASQVVSHRNILNATPIRMQDDGSRTRTLRPISPVKMISNLLGGVSLNHPSSPSKVISNAPNLKNVSSMGPPVFPRPEPEKSYQIDEKQSNNKVTVVAKNLQDVKDPLALMEDTFTAYVVALHSRSGNVVAKVLRGRAAADELIVNELYNILVEDPSKVQAAAEVSVDVLFAAFEKFLKRAWREHMGPLLATDLLIFMQSKLDSGRPNEFTQHFKNSLEEMTPQNRRAFTATVKLLSDLLDASGNDGDRGALIASFAEALVSDGNPHDYITLLDRLVDDYDNLFDNFPHVDADTAVGSLKRTRSFNTGSLSSNASSLRKRFGFGNLSRENSKSESESKVASVWRTLSKNSSKHTGETSPQPGSLSKASLLRSRSTDTDSRMLPRLRPGSRDRPTSSGSHDEPRSRPGSSHLNISTLSTIGEGTPNKPAHLNKKKRRSSLSDLTPLKDLAVASPWSPPSQLRKPTGLQQFGTPVKTSPRIPSASKAPVKMPPRIPSSSKATVGHQPDKSSPNRFGSPERFGYTSRSKDSPLQRYGTPQQKENSPSVPRPTNPAKPIRKVSEKAAITTPTAKKRNPSQSTALNSSKGLSERTWPPNGTTTPAKKPPTPSQKLRMQSPQKLRERLSQEQKALSGAEAGLQAEINKIGEELSAFKLHQPTPTPSHGHLPSPAQKGKTFENLTTTLASLESKLQTFITTTSSRTDALSSDLESSFLVADKKAKKLDELYREANAENEALYERFNEELGKILKGVKAGRGEEMKGAKMKEYQEEITKLKKDNARLKREVVGLKSLTRE